MLKKNGRLLALTLLLPAALFADQHPNTARGFDIGKTYQMNGIDNVNLFNGNLTVTLPIGQRYRVNGNLSYGLTLVYSGNVWDNLVYVETLQCGSNPPALVKKTYPNRRSNAGLGWLLSLGRLFPKNAPPLAESIRWSYETPDGSLHEFYPELHGNDSGNSAHSFTRDGSYLRMTVAGSVRTIEFPDGTSQVFKELQTPTNGIWTPYENTGVWRLVEIKDRFANSVTVEYSSAEEAGSAPAYAEIWTIRDGVRTQKVYFTVAGNSQAPSPYNVLLDRVELTTFAGTPTSTWKAAYAYQTMTPGSFHARCGSSYTAHWVNVPLLTSLTLPAVENVSQVYSMLDSSGAPNYYNETEQDLDVAFPHPKNGHLRGMQLPTKGWLEWDSAPHVFYQSSEEGISRSIAVSRRRMLTVGRALVGEWIYGRVQSTGKSCEDSFDQIRKYGRSEQLVVSVTSPENVTSVHYFSTFDPSLNPTNCVIDPPSPFSEIDYSLPFSRAVSKTVDGVTWYLSSETFNGPVSSLSTGHSITDPNAPPLYRISSGGLVRSEWVAYKTDEGSPPTGEPDYNARETARATYFEDDSACVGGICYAGVRRFGFDGAGHFRQSSTSSNFPAATNQAGNFKTTFTNFAEIAPNGTWLLNLYGEKCTVDQSQAQLSAFQSCSEMAAANSVVSGPFITKACFDATTGFLNRTRALKGTGLGENDVVAAFTNDGHGNVAREDYHGGDWAAGVNAKVATSDFCTTGFAVTPPTPTYSINHLYSSTGDLTETKYSGFTFKAVDNTINANTGLVASSRDTAGLQTSYSYDALGRVEQVARTGEAPIVYEYTEATATTPAQVKVNQVSNSTGTGNTTQEKTIEAVTIFDGFGRAVEEHKLMPSGMAKRTTEYTASGWVKKVSQWEATPSNFTVFSNFDASGRARMVTAPDGSVSTIDYSGTNDGGSRIVQRTVSVRTSLSTPQQTSATTIETYDSLGRLIEVQEPDNISDAKYEYDAADRLIEVTMTGALTTASQARSFTYDGRGFLGTEVHPESGTTTYGDYDARGHVGKKFAGLSDSPFDLRYQYDAAGRLVAVTHPPSRGVVPGDPVKTFTFADANDGSNYRMGKLVTATRRNYSPKGVIDVTETYKYEDPAGRLSSKETTIGGFGLQQTYTQGYTYNDLGMLASTTYPSCAQCAAPALTVTPTFRNGLLKTITNFASDITYDLNGMVTKITHPGGIDDVITPDATKMPRPSRIEFNSYDACTAPGISQQPADQQISAGSTAMVTVVATAPPASTPQLTYQWFKDDSLDPLPNESGSSCCTGGISTSGKYKVRIINSCGKVDSNTAFVRVCGSPSITSHPQWQMIASGGNATLGVAAAGCSPTYQWYIGNSGDTTGGVVGTGSSYNTGPLNENTSYWAKVTDSSGISVNSSAAMVTICAAPAITAHPVSAGYSGTPITLSVVASGCGPFTYQWYRAASPTPSNPVGNGKDYVVQGLTATTEYWVRVVDKFGAIVNSTTATITVTACTPVVTQQPQAETTYSGSPITLSVAVAEGCPPYHYQWYKDPPPYILHPVGVDSPLLSVEPPAGTTSYYVRITDSGGGQAESDVAIVRCAPATISVQPQSATYPGTPVPITVTPNGCGPFNYAWYSGLSGNTTTQIFSGSSTFTTPALTSTGRYWVRVYYDNSQAWVDSSTIVITVPLPTPGPLTATLDPIVANKINVNWGASSGQDRYELQRLAQGAWTTMSVTGTSYADSGLAPNTTYVYRARAVDQYGGSGSGYASDLATTMSFPTLTANVTAVAFSHFDQVRGAINAIRAAHGDIDLSWRQMLDQAGYPTAPEPAQGAVRAVHVLGLRDGMNKARTAVGVAPPGQGYTDTLATTTAIRAVHINELRQRAQ